MGWMLTSPAPNCSASALSSPTTAVSSHWLHAALQSSWAWGLSRQEEACASAVQRLSMPMLYAGLSQLTSALRMTGTTT
ncbi:hypothetical protein COSO111634_31655 [Corallococcus soli]